MTTIAPTTATAAVAERATTLTADVPELGRLVRVRNRLWIVGDVAASQLAEEAMRPGATPQHLVTLRCVDEDAAPGEELQVIWEIETGARVVEGGGFPAPTRFDDPDRFDAFLDAVRWGAVSPNDPKRMLAPFQSGIDIETYQLEPLYRAIRMPRVSLLIADDVGLGKTIEAGLIVQELLLRYRARRVLIVVPADIQLQWQSEMREKFGLSFEIIDSTKVKELRRSRGVHVNPWTHHPRLITSIDYLKRERAWRRFDETLPHGDEPLYPRRYDLLIVDEAHNVAPSGRGNYAMDSQRTKTVRNLVPHFEHRLFLTATPHNGYDESFESLLALLDEQRFAAGIETDRAKLAEVMVRRLKSEIAGEFDGRSRFAKRSIEALEVDYSPEEREAHRMLEEYAASRIKRAGDDGSGRYATEFVLKLLKKRLFSSPAAFLRTIGTHRETMKRRAAGEVAGEKHRTPSENMLRKQLQRIDEEAFETEAAWDEAADDAQAAAASAVSVLTNEESTLLDKLASWADVAASRPDTKALRLIEEIEQLCRPGGRWGDERIIVFTEYRDTLNWLFEELSTRGLAARGRTEMLHGSLDRDERERVKAAFQADPSDSPVRILLATDAASEGVNLQNHCHRLVHFEIPWNPNRLEQRNGRVDRYGQQHEVLIHHFAPRGFERDAVDMPSRPGDIEGDLEFLARAVEKTERMRLMLGSVGNVIADRVASAMLGRKVTLATDEVEKRTNHAAAIMKASRDLEGALREIADAYDETRAEQRLTPANIQRAVSTALELVGQPQLQPAAEPGTFTMPQFTSEAWKSARDGLIHPYTELERPITFDQHVAGKLRDKVVYCHLGHRLVQLSLALLRSQSWSSGTGGLARVTARYVDDPRIRVPVVVAWGRLVVTGREGHRLDEEVIYAGGELVDSRFRRFDTRATLDAALTAQTTGPVTGELADRLLAMYETAASGLETALDARVRERTERLEKRITDVATREGDNLAAILTELRTTILSKLDSAPDEQLALFSSEETEQFERNRDTLRRRADEIPQQIEQERARIQARFADPRPWHFPLAVEFLVPRSMQP